MLDTIGEVCVHELVLLFLSDSALANCDSVNEPCKLDES